MTMTPQCKMILKHLKSKPLTFLTAIQLYQILNLKGRVHELRRMGYNIRTAYGQRGRKRWAIYSLKR